MRGSIWIGRDQSFLAIPINNATPVARSSPIHRGGAQLIGKEGPYENQVEMS